MKKPSSRIREEINKLQDQLKQAEAREAERIGRIALKAGFGDFELEESVLQAAFEELATRFRAHASHGRRKHGRDGDVAATHDVAPVAAGSAAGGSVEA